MLVSADHPQRYSILPAQLTIRNDVLYYLLSWPSAMMFYITCSADHPQRYSILPAQQTIRNGVLYYLLSWPSAMVFYITCSADHPQWCSILPAQLTIRNGVLYYLLSWPSAMVFYITCSADHPEWCSILPVQLTIRNGVLYYLWEETTSHGPKTSSERSPTNVSLGQTKKKTLSTRRFIWYRYTSDCHLLAQSCRVYNANNKSQGHARAGVSKLHAGFSRNAYT